MTSTLPASSIKEAPEPMKVPQWKFGNEFAPYHPQASHCNPDYRDGWNHCYRAAEAAIKDRDAEIERLRAARPNNAVLVPADQLRELQADAGRWHSFEKALAQGLPSPGHRRKLRLIEVCPMYGDEKEIADVRAAIDAMGKDGAHD